MRWEELRAPLRREQRTFLDQFLTLRGATLGATSHYFGALEAEGTELVALRQPTSLGEADPVSLHQQYLPRPVHAAYEMMMEAMWEDLGRRLLVESGFRSSAYQLYLFLFYLPTHDYSITETNRFVALPGHSEHGYPPRQAIDFINEMGINGEERPDEFEALPEYRWLTQHAGHFGFALSYPRDNPYNTAFEPWHWHYVSP